MTDPYRRLFLDQLGVVIEKDPSRKALLELLQTATPGLGSLGTANEIKKHFKTLMLRVHPDKHPQNVSRATRLCQDAQNFYDECMACPPEAKRRRMNPSWGMGVLSVLCPQHFSASGKWTFLHNTYQYPRVRTGLSEAEMSSMVAHQCINARGAIAHGRAPECIYDADSAIARAKDAESVSEFFEMVGGVKELVDIDDIKQELMANGPVVSTSFRPSQAYLRNNNMGKQSGILIIGWKQISSGEVWLVQPLHQDGGYASSTAHVAVGQFGIDGCCLTPTNTFANVPWQAGPYFDVEEWLRGKSLFCFVSCLNDLEPLLKQLGVAPFSGLLKSSPIVTVRHKFKKAQSRKGYLRSIQWVENNNQWEITFSFVAKRKLTPFDLY